MGKIFICLFAGFLAGEAFSVIAAEAPDLKYGLYISYGMDTFREAGETGTQLPAERFAPASINVKAWVRAAKESGMTFAVLTVKSGAGFCLWDSLNYDYDIAHSPFKGDLIADFITACNAEGILPGVYYAIPDAHNEGVARYQGDVPPPYFNVIKQHIAELNTKYPELRVLILNVATHRLSPAQYDGLSQIAKRLNPRCAFWSSDKIGDADTRFVPATVSKSWIWSPSAALNPTQQLLNAYRQSQSADKAFILNVSPGRSGNIPTNQIAVLLELKNLIANRPTKTSAAEGASAKPDVAARLKQVKDLYHQGLIPKEDYDKKVKEIMDSL